VASIQSPDTVASAPPSIEDLLKEGDPVTRRWATSNVRRAEYQGRTVYAKQYLEQPDLGITREIIRRRTGREIDLFDRMWSCRPSHPRLGIPKLVHGDADSGVLVTEEVQGRAISKLMYGPFRNPRSRECRKAFYLVGKWLRWFQSLPVQPGDELRFADDDPQDLVEYCDVRLRKILELGYGWPDDSVRHKIREGLTRLIGRSSQEDLRHVWCHGDYGPQNVLWDGHTLAPLDFGTSHADHPLVDVTYFIHRLEMLRIYFPWGRWPIAAWKRAILRGYGRPDAERSPMYRAMMIRHLHCRLKTYVRRPPLNIKQRVHNAWTRQRVRARLLALVAQA